MNKAPINEPCECLHEDELPDEALNQCGVYAIEHLPSGKQYVAGSRNMLADCKDVRRKLRAGRHHGKKLQRLWNESTPDDFSVFILEECSLEALPDRKQHWIDSLAPQLNTHRKAHRSHGINQEGEQEYRQSILEILAFAHAWTTSINPSRAWLQKMERLKREKESPWPGDSGQNHGKSAHFA